jgi:hypothetical protein
MRIFKTRVFTRWARKENVTDEIICKAIKEIQTGLVDADLGSNLYKKRVALRGRGKRGSARTLLAYQVSEKAFFIYGFMKNEKENISPKELKAIKLIATNLLSYNEEALQAAIKAGELKEVTYV